MTLAWLLLAGVIIACGGKRILVTNFHAHFHVEAASRI